MRSTDLLIFTKSLNAEQSNEKDMEQEEEEGILAHFECTAQHFATRIVISEEPP